MVWCPGPLWRGWPETADVVAGVVARIPAKRRKDAVVAIEQVLTASPEFFELGANPIGRHTFHMNGNI
ncbi:hypothetical protein PO002_40400 [Cupriavidus necator]|uniref:hypothetical protein n=1 Tax=Cupriavidus necator TaxID=106590 RepID=UPI0039C1A555